MTPAVEAAFNYRNCDVVRYVDYWERLTARTDAALFRCFLFAYCSVHTTWEGNVNGYQAIKDFERWQALRDARKGLRTRLVSSGAGLHNHRARWIGEFSDDYWRAPDQYRRRSREAWPVYRNRIEARIKGLGPAKVSFALELAFPLEAEVVCLDVHMLRMYGKKDQNLKAGEYERYEHDWLGRARAAEVPSFIIKQIHWDAIQGRLDSRYWSHVLEEQ